MQCSSRVQFIVIRKLCIVSIATLLPVLVQAVHEPEFTEVIVSTHRSDQHYSQVDANITAISGDDIEQTAATHISELLFQAPGTWVSRGNGQESLVALRSPVQTGGGGCAGFIFAEDGVPLRPRAFCNVNELFEAHSEQAARVEVIRGPGGSFYGSGAVHGVINIVGDQPGTAPAYSRLALEAGPHDYYRARLRSGGEQWLLRFTGTSDGGYKDESGFDQQKLSLRVDTDTTYSGRPLSVRSQLALTNLNQETAGYLLGLDAYKDDSLKKINSNPEAYRDARSARWQSRFDIQLSNNRELRITPYARWADIDFLLHFQPGTPLEKSGYRGLGLQSVLVIQGEEGGGRWSLGLDLGQSRGFLKQRQRAASFAVFPQGEHYNYVVDASLVSPFVQYRKNLNSQWRLTLGLRADYQCYDYSNKLPDGEACVPSVASCRYLRPTDQDQEYFDLSPDASLSWAATSEDRLYLRLANAHRAPHTAELFKLEAGQRLAQIDSEHMQSLELGWRHVVSKLLTELNLFAMRKRNVIFKDSNRQSIDNGKTRHRGVELLVDYRPSAWWDLALSATYAEHQYRRDIAPLFSTASESIKGNSIDTAPRVIGRAQLGLNPGDRWRLALEWLHMGRYYLGPENSLDYPGHTLLNLRSSYELDGWSLSLRLLNLRDANYAERADLQPFSSPPDARYFVGEPRSVYVGVEYRI